MLMVSIDKISDNNIFFMVTKVQKKYIIQAFS